MLMNTLRHLALIAGVTLLWASSLSAQVEPGAVGGAMPEEDDARMNVPPLLAGTPLCQCGQRRQPRECFHHHGNSERSLHG